MKTIFLDIFAIYLNSKSISYKVEILFVATAKCIEKSLGYDK